MGAKQAVSMEQILGSNVDSIYALTARSSDENNCANGSIKCEFLGPLVKQTFII